MSKPASSKKDFLLDVHTEPLPARFIPPAVAQLEAHAVRWLTGKISFERVSAFGTLRHLILRVDGLAAKGVDVAEKFKGPKESVWKAPDGSFTAAAEGFARKHGLKAGDLRPEDGVLYAEIWRKGEPTQRPRTLRLQRTGHGVQLFTRQPFAELLQAAAAIVHHRLERHRIDFIAR